jgi:CRISPR type I-A-associated protein Csa5
MTEKLVLYTPSTGFPDLEVKIAYGLARIAIEAGASVEIHPMGGLYKLEFANFDGDKFNKSFILLAQRLLSSPRWFDLGVKARFKSNYPTALDGQGHDRKFKERLKKNNLISLYTQRTNTHFNFDKEKSCKHTGIPKYGSVKEDSGQMGGLILQASHHAGKPQIRDVRQREFNLGLCEVCGYLATLGSISFCITTYLGKRRNRKYVLMLPIPSISLSMQNLLKILSMQKVISNNWLSDLIPLRVFPLGLLARFPSLGELVKETGLIFHLSLLSKDNRGDTVVEQTSTVNVLPYVSFIDFSPYNCFTVELLLGSWSDKNPPKIASLSEILSLLEFARKDILTKFARLYSQETSSNNFTNLLYPKTAKYLLKEVAMIDSNIIESEALGSLARTLRYFVREKKYGYADDIRNARRDSSEFEGTIAKMLREGRLRLEQKKNIHLPSEQEMKEVFRLANEDFEGVKTALVILAFSFPSKVEEIETIEEVQDA